MAKPRDKAEVIRAGHADWERLYKAWKAEGKPGMVVIGSHNYKAIGFDRDVIFQLQYVENTYKSTSTSGTADFPRRRP